MIWVHFKTANGTSSQPGNNGSNFYGDCAVFHTGPLNDQILRVVQNDSVGRSFSFYLYSSGFSGLSLVEVKGAGEIQTFTYSGVTATAPTGNYINATFNKLFNSINPPHITDIPELNSMFGLINGNYYLNSQYIWSPAGSSGAGGNVLTSTSPLNAANIVDFNSWVIDAMRPTLDNYQLISGMSSYLTTALAASTYQPISSMSNYLTTTMAANTYQPSSAMSNYLTTASATSTYLTKTSASTTYQTVSGMSGYLTTALAASTYQTVANMANYINTVSTVNTDAAQNIQLTRSGNTLSLDYSNLMTTLSNYLGLDAAIGYIRQSVSADNRHVRLLD
jgi:hypothetical protein